MLLPALCRSLHASTTRSDIEASAFWLLCIEELGLDGDGDGLLALAHIVTGFDPDRVGAGLVEERVERHRRLVMGLVVAKAQQITHRSPP